MSNVAILVPILNRPHRIIPLLESIEAATPQPHEVIFAASDAESIDVLDKIDARYITDEGGDEGSWPKRINRLYQETQAPYIFTGADDLNFRPGWFEAAVRTMMQFPNESGVVAVTDLMNNAGVHFLISRRYIQEFGASGDGPGTLMHEGYRHQYTDDECRAVAKHHGRWAISPDAVVEHLHVGAGKAPMDDTYRIGEATGSQGRELFASRAHLWTDE